MLNTIDLFAGCGGLSKGFLDAGFNVILGVDNNEPALQTFAYNHNGAKTLNADLSDNKTFEIIDDITEKKKIDIIQMFTIPYIRAEKIAVHMGS